MIADVVLNAPEKHEAPGQKTTTPGRRDAVRGARVFKTGDIVIQMLHHIKAGNQIKRIVRIRQCLRGPELDLFKPARATKDSASAETSTPSAFPNSDSI